MPRFFTGFLLINRCARKVFGPNFPINWVNSFLLSELQELSALFEEVSLEKNLAKLVKWFHKVILIH